MAVYIDPTTRLIITFFRDGQELDQRTARDGNRALKMALLMLAELDELQAGDMLRCWEA